MKSFLPIVLIVLLKLLVVNKNNAQYSELGVGLGISTYWGDLNGPSFSTNLFKNSGLALQLSYRQMFGKNIGVRGAFSIGTFKGDDANSSIDWQKLRNLNFKSPITELAVMGEYYFFGFDTDPGSSIFSPFITVGIAGFKFDPKTTYQGNEIRLQPLGTEGQGMPGFGDKYGLYSFSIPFGAGAKLILSESLNLSFEVILRKSFTDYIDDLSTNYVNYDDLRASNGALSANLSNRMNEYLGQSEPVQLATGSQRGGAKVNDYYAFTMFTINFMINDSKGRRRFGRSGKVICPTF